MTCPRPSHGPARNIRPLAAMPLALGLCAAILMGAACSEQQVSGQDGSAALAQASAPSTAPPQKASSMVKVRVFNGAGELVGPLDVPKYELTDAEWRAKLTPEQYRITRDAGTERAFCGTLLDNKLEGVYTCIGCGLPLFASNSKFKSGTGWPSFFQPIAPENVAEKVDNSYGMRRTEINCARCDSHLGHVFDDGPQPTGLRFCLNSESLGFTPQAGLASLADPAAEADHRATPATGAAAADAPQDGQLAEAVFAGGCFWCVEAVFEELDGVAEAISGYAGGKSAATANYDAVCSGTTGHAEAVKLIYDPARISYVDLLEVHFATHDPTTLNRQGADVGTQYRSAIFFADEEERQLAEAFIADLDDSKHFSSPIVTTLEPLTEFYPAESYHQNYVCNNPMQGYVRGVALPKVEKVRKQFADKLKDTSPLGQ